MGVHDTRDELGRHRYFAVGEDFERTYWKKNKAMEWFAKAAPEAKEGEECCVKEWIATHYIQKEEMRSVYEMEKAMCRPPTTTWPFLAFV